MYYNVKVNATYLFKMTILVHEKDTQSEVLLFEIYGKSNANKAIFQ